MAFLIDVPLCFPKDQVTVCSVSLGEPSLGHPERGSGEGPPCSPSTLPFSNCIFCNGAPPFLIGLGETIPTMDLWPCLPLACYFQVR